MHQTSIIRSIFSFNINVKVTMTTFKFVIFERG